MAIYQFHINFFPTSGILDHIPKTLPSSFLPKMIDSKTDLDTYEDPQTIFWKGYIRKDFEVLIEELNNRLPEIEWKKNLTDVYGWGNEETNDLNLSFTDQNEVESFSSRIDLRNIDKEFVDFVLKLTESRDYLICDSKGNLGKPNKLELGRLIRTSNSAKFVVDPHKFLNDISSEKLDIE